MSKIDTEVIKLLYDSFKNNNISVNSLQNILFNDKQVFTDKFLYSVEFKECISKLTNLFDFNNDGTLDVHDIEFLKQNVTNISFMINLVNSGISVANYVVNTFSNATFTKNDVLDVAMKIVMYSLFLPLVTVSSFKDWIGQHTFDQNKTNLDILFGIINTIYDYVNSSKTIANIANSFINKILAGSCCCKKSENIDTVASETFDNSIQQLKLATQLHVLDKKINNQSNTNK